MKLDGGRTRSSVGAWLCLVAIWAVGSASHDVANRGLARKEDAVAVPPAMVAFFRGRPEEELPEALNSTDPIWGVPAGRVAPPGPERMGRSNRNRRGLLVGSLVCGFVGAGLLCAAVLVYVRRGRKAEPESRTGLEVVLGRRSGPEVRLGGP